MSGRSHRRGVSWIGVGSTLAILILCGLPGLGYLTGRIQRHYVADADLLLLHELIPDVASGGSVRDWYIPAASYMFPDWPLYGIALGLGRSPSATIAIFAVLQFLLLAAAIYLLARAVGGKSPVVVTLSALSVVVFAALWNAYPIVLTASSYIHAGTAIMGVALLALLIAWCRRPTSQLLAAGGGLSFLGVASDSLFLIWSVGPALAAIALLAVARRGAIRQYAQWAGTQLLAAVLALRVPDLLFPRRSSYGLEIGFQPRFGWNRFYSSLDQIRALSPLLIPAILVAVVLSAFVLFRNRSLFGVAYSVETRLTIVAYAVTVALASVASQVALVGDVPPHPRYGILMFLLPLVVAPVLALAGIGEALGRPNPARLAVVTLALLPLLVVSVTAVSLLDEVDVEYSPIPAACVEAALSSSGSDHGIASYWDARPFEIYSEGRLTVAEIGPDLEPYRVNANGADYIQQYDFAIVSSLYGFLDLPTEELLARVGSPMNTTECSSWTVLDYGPGGLTQDELTAES